LIKVNGTEIKCNSELHDADWLQIPYFTIVTAIVRTQRSNLVWVQSQMKLDVNFETFSGGAVSARGLLDCDAV
jgi:hypothetical protein